VASVVSNEYKQSNAYAQVGRPAPKQRWLKLAENKTFQNFSNNIAIPMISAATTIDGIGEAYQLGKGVLRYNLALDFYMKQGFSEVKALEHWLS